MQLQGKTDQRFVEHSFKLFRDCLGVRTVLTTSQFLDQVRVHHMGPPPHGTMVLLGGVAVRTRDSAPHLHITSL